MEGELFVESCGAQLFGRGSSTQDPKQSWNLPGAEGTLGVFSFHRRKVDRKVSYWTYPDPLCI